MLSLSAVFGGIDVSGKCYKCCGCTWLVAVLNGDIDLLSVEDFCCIAIGWLQCKDDCKSFVRSKSNFYHFTVISALWSNCQSGLVSCS
jgi:hypothetical protein